MSQTKNYAIGTRGEKRIIKKLEDLGAVITENGHHNHVPDIKFRVGKNNYAAELKTLLILHSHGKTGSVKISRTEYRDMESLQSEKCMIVEVRSRTQRKHAYLLVPWSRVEDYFTNRNPSIATIGLHWILLNSVNLEFWVKNLEVAAV